MKRKLIDFKKFKDIETSATSFAENELVAAEEILGKALNVEGLQLHCFGENQVTYQNADGSYVHANYEIKKDQLVLENIEELVIEEDSEKKEAKKILSDMIEAIVDNKDFQANEKFESYLALPVFRRNLLDEAFKITVSKPSGKRSKLFHKKQSRSLVSKRIRAMIKTKRKLSATPSQKSALDRKRNTAATKLGGSTNPRWRTYARKLKPKMMKEWTNMVENVIDYIDYKELGPVLSNVKLAHDDKGNVTALSVPTMQKRNEAKILNFNWKTMNTEVKILRSKMKNLAENIDFCKAMAELKRYNNASDNAALEETLEAISLKWPNLIYLTQKELANQIAEALETANVKKYDDSMTNFMAEGILWKIHNAYSEKVKRITNLAGADVSATTEGEKAYENFQTVCEKFYTKLDETDESETKLYADLFAALREVYKLATENGDEQTRSEVASYLTQCEHILNKESNADLQLVENAVELIFDLTEANLEGASQDWEVSNTPHETENGDNPRANWNAKQTNAVPSNFSGDWREIQPVADGKDLSRSEAEEMETSSWSNYANDDTYPDLKNPYLPKPMPEELFKIKDEKEGPDMNDTSSDTWPTLNNPYVPQEKKIKANNDNLVVDQ